MKLIKKHQFGGLIESLSNLLKPKYSVDERPTGPTPPAPGWSKLPIMEVDKPVDTKTYNGGTLPGITVSAINLSKPQPFPYGGINVISKSINGGLDKKQRVFVNPFDKSYLASNYKEGGLIRKHQFGGSSKSNIFLPKQIKSIPEITINGTDKRLWFDRRQKDLGNGYKVTSDVIFDYYDGGNSWLGDMAKIKGARTIYSTPKGNDTIFWNNRNNYTDNGEGLISIGSSEKGAKTNFYNLIRKNKMITTGDGSNGALDRAIKGYQKGGEFKEDLTPPSRGLFGEIGTNLQQGNEIFGRMVSSTPVQLLLTGITSGIGGMFGPTMKVSKTAKELVTNPRNAIRKFSRNLNARKGDPTYRWTKTSGNLREGGAQEYQFPGIGSRTRMKINSAARSEGSGYSAQPTLNANPTYQRASAPAQTPMQRTWNHQRSVPVEWSASRRVMQRNNLIDQARDWRNYIFESPRFGGANFKVIPKNQQGTTKGGIQPSDNTRVQHIPNKEGAIYEKTPQGIGDFLPLVGTYRAAQRIDKGEPNANYGDLIVNGSMDLLGAGMVGSVIKAAGKANRIHKALKASGFRQVGPESTKFIKTANRTKISRGYMNPDKYYHINLGPEVIAEKTVPNVDYYNVVMQPMIQSLRVPATAPFK